MSAMIRGSRDSLGVPIEPDEEIPLGRDYYDDPIYEGSHFYITPDGYLLEESIDQYIEDIFGVPQVAEACDFE